MDQIDQDISLLKPLTDPDATFNWLIEDFTQKKADAVSQTRNVIYSVPFFFHPNGYQMRLKMYPNGCGSDKGSHVSLYLEVIRGPNDDKLKWPYS